MLRIFDRRIQEARQGKADARIGTRLSSSHGAQMRED